MYNLGNYSRVIKNIMALDDYEFIISFNRNYRRYIDYINQISEDDEFFINYIRNRARLILIEMLHSDKYDPFRDEKLLDTLTKSITTNKEYDEKEINKQELMKLGFYNNNLSYDELLYRNCYYYVSLCDIKENYKETGIIDKNDINRLSNDFYFLLSVNYFYDRNPLFFDEDIVGVVNSVIDNKDIVKFDSFFDFLKYYKYSNKTMSKIKNNEKSLMKSFIK